MSSWRGRNQRGRRGWERQNYNRSNHGGYNNMQCYKCEGYGHIARDCHIACRVGGRGGGSAGSSNIDLDRRFFCRMTFDPSSRIGSNAEASHLLRSALSFAQVEGASALLYRLSDDKLQGIQALRKSLEFMTEKQVFVDGFLPLLDFLGRDDLNKPVYSIPLKSILRKLYNMPFLVPCIAEHCQKEHVTTNTQRTALIWFLTTVCLESEEARSDDGIKKIAEYVGQFGGASNLKTVLGDATVAESEAPSLADVRVALSECPGGRHNNDKEDFRSILIVPTLEEFLCETDPYLPKMSSEAEPTLTEARLLDSQFRLLREDLIGPSKEQQDDPRKEHRDIVYGLQVCYVNTGAPVYRGQGDKRTLIIGQTDPSIDFRIKLPHKMYCSIKEKSMSEREAFFDRNRRFLPRDALVCLQRRDEDNVWTPIRFATIARREPRELAHPSCPLIGLSFLSEQDVKDTLKELFNRYAPPTRLFVISSELFAYAPILRGLQMMPSIPLSEEIVMSKTVPAEEVVDIFANTSEEIRARLNTLDEAQSGALANALKQRVALIQGPPGTGKTFIGVLLAQALLSISSEKPKKILVVTYTNHSLDDFLEELLKVGITNIVRLGGRSRSSRLFEYNLRELANRSAKPFSREQSHRRAQLRDIIDTAEEDVGLLEAHLQQNVDIESWRSVGRFLKEKNPEQWRQLSLEQKGGHCYRLLSSDYLWKAWLRGLPPPSFLQSAVGGDLWLLNRDGRWAQVREWQQCMDENKRGMLATALARIATAKRELRQLAEVADAAVLSRARVIGCTTTKAAMCKNLLDSLSPEIVMVEEAAEIMEAHVLTSLSVATKKLVMIGDHKQLRPKCQHYPLTVEANRGFDLNRSLFERLASCLPISTLQVQHRMHPEISAIPKLVTYPNLRDAASVKKHPSPLGLPSRIIFIDHRIDEDRETDLLDTLDTASRTNMHEVGMIAGSVRYLLQQGYRPADLVVLTPYLGQMIKIQRALAKDCDVLVAYRDLAEAREQLDCAEVFPSKRENKESTMSSVRVATIDNYQGEEAKIVLVSLVRSNTLGHIGFLKEAARVNVMLSRARECEIIVGNRWTLESAKGSVNPLCGGPLWQTIFRSLVDSGVVYEGLPVTCQGHGTYGLVKTGLDFQRICPDGGCTKVCGKELSCGHVCRKWCHAGACMQCSVLCEDVCTRGHPLIRECSQDPPDCRHIMTWKCPLNHHQSGPCYLGKFQQCGSCFTLAKESDERRQERIRFQNTLDKKNAELDRLNRSLEEARKRKEELEEVTKVDRELSLARKALKTALRAEQHHMLIDTGSEPTTISLVPAQEGAPHPPNMSGQLVETSHQAPRDPSAFLNEHKRGCDNQHRPVFKRPISTSSLVEQERKRPKLFGSSTTQHSENTIERSLAPNTPTANELGRKREETEREQAVDSTPRKEPVQKKRRKGETNESEVGGVGVNGGTEQQSTMSRNDMHRVPTKSPTAHDATSADYEAGAGSAVAVKKQGETDQIDQCSQSKELPCVVKETEECFKIIFARYKSQGVLGADDLREQMFPENAKCSDSVRALSYLFRQELDPRCTFDASSTYEKNGSDLSTTLLAVANAFACEQNYPRQARDFALIALEYTKSKSLVEMLPSSWIGRLKEIAERSSAKPSASNLATSAKVSTVADEWRDVLQADRSAPSVMRDSILPMVGLDEVKQKFIKIYHRLKVAKDQNDCAAASYNVRFEGNPGTGKTTIARHYGKFLIQLGILNDEALFREISGAKLIHEGVKGLKDILEEIQKAGGGVVFVDEAYQLALDREGKKALDFILPVAESLSTEYGEVVWVFAGYKKPMEKLFEHNEGLPSRFPIRFVFEDYSDEDLQKIFEDMMKYKDKTASSNKARKKKQNAPAQSNNISYLGRTYSGTTEGSTMMGRKGGTWTYRRCKGWTDQFGNLTVDPSRVGNRNTELVSPAGDTWLEEGGLWKNQGSGASQAHYPGSPAPLKSNTRERRPNPFQCENDKDLRISIRRLGRCRGTNGFGNARAVRGLFDTVRERQATRLAEERKTGRSPCVFTFKKTDLLGPIVTASTLKKSLAWKELEAMEGLLPVKESVEQIFQLALKNINRERREEPLYEIALNRLFLGNPGTGKTTVAKLYGNILADLGLLSKGEVMMKCASDFIGEALGQSEKHTQSILKAAEGCVLVIDEAYELYSGGGSGKKGMNDPYKTAVIDTIVEKVQAKPGADIAVILLGYKDEMEEMMRNVNPGLSRRFQIENAFNFPDFDDASLCRIMLASARKRGAKLSIDVAKRAVRLLARARAKPNFGNAGSVDNLLSKAITTMQSRDGATELVATDFGCSSTDGPNSDVLDSLFDDLIGNPEVKRVMEDLRATVEFSAAQGMPPNSGVSYNYLFLGAPGTGKTTFARRMGKMFHALGLLASDEIKEAKASDLVTGYANQAALQTRELLKESLGGVLFVDEAYELNPSVGGPYMSEAVGALVGALTEPQFKGKLLVVLAGYDEDMEEMLKTNPGLHSRFKERIHFHNFDVDATVELLQMELKRLFIPLAHSDNNERVMRTLAQRLVNSKDFGNGRDVVSWAESTYKAVAKRHRASRQPAKGDLTSSMEAVEEALNDMLKSRKVREGGPKCATVNKPAVQAMESQPLSAAAPPPPITKETVAVATDESADMAEQEAEKKAAKEEEEVPDDLFAGINDGLLRTLQDIVDELGLGSKEGSRHLASLDRNSQEFADIAARLERELNMGHADAVAQLIEWQSRHESLEELLRAQEKKTETLGVRPIWRCGVCGQADKPWIACYVAPFIVRYEKVPI